MCEDMPEVWTYHYLLKKFPVESQKPRKILSLLKNEQKITLLEGDSHRFIKNELVAKGEAI